MRKFRIPYIPYRSLLLSTTILNDIYIYISSLFDLVNWQLTYINMHVCNNNIYVVT